MLLSLESVRLTSSKRTKGINKKRKTKKKGFRWIIAFHYDNVLKAYQEYINY